VATTTTGTALPALPLPLDASPAARAAAQTVLRNDWARDEVQAIYDSPLIDLLFYGVRARAALIIYMWAHRLTSGERGACVRACV
jgi:biotin synthase